jgi:hypothetical protein
VTFDPANIAASKVTATIKASDILAGYPSDYVANHAGHEVQDLGRRSRQLDQLPRCGPVSDHHLCLDLG